MTELKPCPFCGGEAEFYSRCSGGYGVKCSECRCDVFDCRYFEAEAVEAWNTRSWTVADNDVEVLTNIADGLFCDLMDAAPLIAMGWAKVWPELFVKVVNDAD